MILYFIILLWIFVYCVNGRLPHYTDLLYFRGASEKESDSLKPASEPANTNLQNNEDPDIMEENILDPQLQEGTSAVSLEDIDVTPSIFAKSIYDEL